MTADLILSALFTFFMSLAGGLAAYVLLDEYFPRDVRFRKVGGLVHWRFGRLGGSFYVARKAR